MNDSDPKAPLKDSWSQMAQSRELQVRGAITLLLYLYAAASLSAKGGRFDQQVEVNHYTGIQRYFTYKLQEVGSYGREELRKAHSGTAMALAC